MMSFQKPRSDGYRYSLTHRTKKTDGAWIVERWNGSNWEYVGAALSDGGAREIAA